MKTQRNKEVYFVKINTALDMLDKVAKSNLDIKTKMLIATTYGFLHGIDEIMYVEDDKYI